MVPPSHSRETVIQRHMLLYEGKYTEEKTFMFVFSTNYLMILICENYCPLMGL